MSNKTVGEINACVSKKFTEVTGQNQNPVKRGEVEGQLILDRIRASIADLITIKLALGRPQGLGDVKHLKRFLDETGI